MQPLHFREDWQTQALQLPTLLSPSGWKTAHGGKLQAHTQDDARFGEDQIPNGVQ